MNAIDWFVILSIAIAAIHGALRGMMKEGAHLIAWVLGLFLAWHVGRFLEPALGGVLAASEVVRMWSARVIVVSIVLVVGAVSGSVLAHYVRPELPAGVDSLAGVALGALRGIMVLGVLVLLGQLLRLDTVNWWHKSTLLPWGEGVANGVRVLVGEQLVHHRH